MWDPRAVASPVLLAREFPGLLIPSQNFYVALLDHEDGAFGYPFFVDEPGPPPAPGSLDRCLANYVIRTGTPLHASPEVIAGLAARGEFEGLGRQPSDWVGAPLKATGKVFGAVVAQTYTPEARFSPSDLDSLTVISGQLALTIERKRAEETLRRSEQRLRGILEHMQDVFFHFDSKLRPVLVSPSGARVYGYGSVEEMKNLTVRDLFSKDEKRHRFFETLKTNGEVIDFVGETRSSSQESGPGPRSRSRAGSRATRRSTASGTTASAST